MSNPKDDWQPGDQYTKGVAIIQSILHGMTEGGPRESHQIFGDFDITPIPDWGFWPWNNGGFIPEVAQGKWEDLIKRLDNIGKDILTNRDNIKKFLAWAIGEPHNLSFTGVGFDFQARGEFTYTKVGTGDSGFRVDVRQRSIGNHAAIIEAVAIKLGPLVIEASMNRLNPTIGGQSVALGVGGVTGFKTTDGKFLGLIIGQFNCFQIIDTSLNVVQVDRGSDHFDLYIELNVDRCAEATGVLGNPLRGLLHLDGTPLPLRVSSDEFRRFASEWAVPAGQTLFTDGAFAAYDPKTPERFLTVADLDKQTRSRAESLARERLGDSANAFLLDACTYDVGFVDDSYQSSYGFHGLPPATSRVIILR